MQRWNPCMYCLTWFNICFHDALFICLLRNIVANICWFQLLLLLSPFKILLCSQRPWALDCTCSSISTGRLHRFKKCIASGNEGRQCSTANRKATYQEPYAEMAQSKTEVMVAKFMRRWLQNFMRKDILINWGISGISCSWSEMFRHPDSDLDIRHFHWNFTEQLVFCCYTIFVFSTTGTMIFFSKCLVSFPSSGPLHEPSAWQDRMPADATAGHCWGLCITTLFVYFRISDTHIHAH